MCIGIQNGGFAFELQKRSRKVKLQAKTKKDFMMDMSATAFQSKQINRF